MPFLYAFYRFWKGLRSGLRDPEFEVLLILTLIILATGTLFYHGSEGWGWIDSLYFSVTTLTTVGFGDLTPHSAWSKIFTMVYILMGMGILFGFVNTLAQHSIKDSSLHRRRVSFFGSNHRPHQIKLPNTAANNPTNIEHPPVQK